MRNEASIGMPLKTYVPGLAEVVGNDLASSADYRYVTHDHLGSTRGMWDQSKNKLGTWEYTPYGSPYNFAGPPDVTQLYTGHDFDPVTGQYYAPFRYLDPAIGRWLKQDPLGMAAGTNVYSYVRNNPIALTDPLGLIDDLGQLGCGTCEAKTPFGQGAQAGAWQLVDVMVPFCDPNLRSGNYDPMEPGMREGKWAAEVGVTAGEMALGLKLAKFRGPEYGRWKDAGEWQEGWHFHLGKGSGLDKHHLPQQFGRWWKNLKNVIRRWWNDE